MWRVPVELITICETDPVAVCPTDCCDTLRHLYDYTEGHGAWVGRRLRVFPHPNNSFTPFARDDAGCTWSLASPTTTTNNDEILEIEVMLKRYVHEEYWQQAQDDLRYREKCVNGVYVPSPDLHNYSSDDGIDD